MNSMREKDLPGDKAPVWGRWRLMAVAVLIVAVTGGTFIPGAWAQAVGNGKAKQPPPGPRPAQRCRLRVGSLPSLTAP